MDVSKATIQLRCIHGNLQLPIVWEPLATALKERFRDRIQITCENIWQTPADSCQQWAEQFCHRVIPSATQRPQVLLGYSLGGRLAFHALLHQPDLWARAVIVAADPRSAAQDKTSQRPTHPPWEARILTTAWEQFLADWDALPVFGGRANLTERPEALFSKPDICHAFRAYAKSKQANLIPQLKRLKRPQILYVTGQDDLKYDRLGQQLAADCSAIQHVTITNAAHRVPWENPSAFFQLINQICEDATQQ